MNRSAGARLLLLANAPLGKFALVCAVGLVGMLSCGQANAIFLDPSDTAIGIDTNAVFGPAGRYPAAEAPAKAIVDNLPGTKYLNFGKEGSGFIVTPSFGSIPIDTMSFTTANDAPERDPASWELYGFDGALTTVSSGPTPAINPSGNAELWVAIADGVIALPDTRGTLVSGISVGAATGYEHYKLVFPTLKNSAAANSMQLAEVQFFDDTATALMAAGDATIGVDGIAAWSGSSIPGPGEAASRVLDSLTSTKYLNFGEEGSGLIVTNSGPAFKVGEMRLSTANDDERRDPMTYELYGTNDDIDSVDNSDGNGGEAWTLLSSGATGLPGGAGSREVAGPWIPINAGADYKSYKLIFPTVRDAAGANSMQVSGVEFRVPEPSSVALVMIGLAAFGAVSRRRAA